MAKNKYSSTADFHDNNLYVPSRSIYFGNTNNVDNSEAEEVNSITVGQVIKNLHILDYMQPAPITLYLNTPGGNVEDGLALYDIMQSIQSRISIIGIGKIYSMGAIVLQGAYKRFLTVNSLLMLHAGETGYYGHPKSVQAWTEADKKMAAQINNILYKKMKVKNPKLKISDIEKIFDHDKIYTSEEAVQVGLVDKVIKKTMRKPK